MNNDRSHLDGVYFTHPHPTRRDGLKQPEPAAKPFQIT
jgi:hypothetical protein